MYLLENPVLTYPWGSRTAIAELTGNAPSDAPQAELWMGAHPKAPSRTAEGPLDRLITANPDYWLGPSVSHRFGEALPFLFKVLAAETPLSLQAHPNREQAIVGFEAEQAAGVPIDAPHRNYRDRNHKPEVICALTPFEALCGFRPLSEIRELFDLLGVPGLTPFLEFLDDDSIGEPARVRLTFAELMNAPGDTRSDLVQATLHAIAVCGDSSHLATSFRWAQRLGQLYPGDIGVIVSLLLNQVTLHPGEALYLPAGQLHAYLEGVGIELMANSDNVLRGGCTPKHVDVPELLNILDFTPQHVQALQAREVEPGLFSYDTPASEFHLSRVEVDGESAPSLGSGGPEILIVTAGTVELHGQHPVPTLRSGQAALVVPAQQPYTLRGQGVVHRASVPALPGASPGNVG